jgi:CheY-like chemotaxis protein
MRTILLADSNQGFAQFMAEELQRAGPYHVVLAASGDEAATQLQETAVDVAVVDAEVANGVPLADFIGQLRRANAALPVILIPSTEADLLVKAPLQGTLPRPFFLPDLEPLLRDLLGLPEPAPSATISPAPAEPPGRAAVIIPERNQRAAEGHVEAMSLALRKEQVLLTQEDRVVTMMPRLGYAGAAALAQRIRQVWEGGGSTSELIRFEGEADSNRYMLYSVHVAGDLKLSVALRARLPLPIVRRIARDTAAELAKLASTEP